MRTPWEIRLLSWELGPVGAWLQYHVGDRGGFHNLFIDGCFAEFQRPDLLGRMGGEIHQATGEVVGLREGAARLFRAVKDYSMLAHQFFRARLERYVGEVQMPLFGAGHFWHRYEFAKYSGHIHFHTFDICAGGQPRMLLREMRGVG